MASEEEYLKKKTYSLQGISVTFIFYYTLVVCLAFFYIIVFKYHGDIASLLV